MIYIRRDGGAGASFDPSVGASFELYSSASYATMLKKNWSTVSKDDKNVVIGTNEQKEAFLEKYNVNLKTKGVSGVDMEGNPNEKCSDGTIITRNENGIMFVTNSNGSNEVAGVTIHRGGWFFNRRSYIYMSPSGSEFFFAVALNHEFIHAYHHLMIGNSTPGFREYSENFAYTNSHMYINTIDIPTNNGVYHDHSVNYWPSDLIPIEH